MCVTYYVASQLFCNWVVNKAFIRLIFSDMKNTVIPL